MTLKYSEDPTVIELFDLAGRASADPGDGEARRAFWRFVDKHGDHEWVNTLRKSAAGSHPHGWDAGQKLLGSAIDDAHGRLYAFQPDWLKGVFQTFERA